MSKTTLLCVAALALSGCGDSAAQFVGTWTYSSGLVTIDCPGQAEQQIPLTGGQLTITEDNATKITGTDSTGCALPFNVSGSTATVVGGSTCTPTGAGGTERLDSGTATLSNNAITFTADGALVPTGAPAGYSCPLHVEGTLSKS